MYTYWNSNCVLIRFIFFSVWKRGAQIKIWQCLNNFTYTRTNLLQHIYKKNLMISMNCKKCPIMIVFLFLFWNEDNKLVICVLLVWILISKKYSKIKYSSRLTLQISNFWTCECCLKIVHINAWRVMFIAVTGCYRPGRPT